MQNLTNIDTRLKQCFSQENPWYLDLDQCEQLRPTIRSNRSNTKDLCWMFLLKLCQNKNGQSFMGCSFFYPFFIIWINYLLQKKRKKTSIQKTFGPSYFVRALANSSSVMFSTGTILALFLFLAYKKKTNFKSRKNCVSWCIMGWKIY